MRLSRITPAPVLLLALAATGGHALAQYAQNFDALNQGSLVGQNGYFQPVAGSNDFQVAAFNDPAAFNINPSPVGGSQTAVGTGSGSSAGFARSQNFNNWGAGDLWTVCFDVWADYQGDPVLHTSNVGSLSMQPFGATPYTNQGVNTLFYYITDGDVASTIAVAWNIHFADGADLGGFWNPDEIAGTWPAGPFSELTLRTWYRLSYVVNFATNTLDKVAITNLATNTATTFTTAGTTAAIGASGDWYIAGGANNALALPRPDQFRLFAGGQGNGNVIAFDNLAFTLGDSLCTTPGCPADFNGDGFLDFFDYGDYVACFEGAGCPDGRTADFNGDAFVDFFDYAEYVAAFEQGC
jgi:hypothetical protein